MKIRDKENKMFLQKGPDKMNIVLFLQPDMSCIKKGAIHHTSNVRIVIYIIFGF